MSLRGRLDIFKRHDTQTIDDASQEHGSSSLSRPKATTARLLRSRLTVYRDESTESRQISQSQFRPQPNRDERPSRLVIAFVNSLTASQLSNFLIWFFYYDLVELPESPALWYQLINAMEMRGWIALGQFLSKPIKYGLDLVVLDSICDRLRLSRTLVRECLIRLAEPSDMSSTLLTVIIQKASLEHTEIEVLEILKFELHEVGRLVSRLTPSDASVMAEWQPRIAKQLKDFVDVVVTSRLAVLRKQPPVLTGLTAEQERKLKYAFEAMQGERHVPLVRYGIVPDPPMRLPRSTSSSSSYKEPPAIDNDIIDQQEEEECLYTAQQLRIELRVVRAENLQLSKENKSLIKVNEQLAKKMLSLSRSKLELMSESSDVPPVTATSVMPGDSATPVPAQRVLNRSSRQNPTTLPNVFKRMTAFKEKGKNVNGRRRFNPESPTIPKEFFSSPLVPSPEDKDDCHRLTDKPLPLQLIDPATNDTVKLPRNVGSNNLKQQLPGILGKGNGLARNDGIVDIQNASASEPPEAPNVVQKISRSGHERNKKPNATSILPDKDMTKQQTAAPSPAPSLIRNEGVDDLQGAVVLQYHNPPAAIKETFSRSASKYSKNPQVSPVQPGPDNSLAEYGARQMGKVTPLPSTTIQRRPSTLGTFRNAVLGIERLHFGHGHMDIASKAVKQGRRRSRSVGNALDGFLRRGRALLDEKEEKEATPDISTNF